MTPLRFAIFGAGFWARYQLAAWRELPGAECVAVCDPARDKAAALAAVFGVPGVYDDPDELLRSEQLDFADVISAVESHAQVVHTVAGWRVPVICQKPLGTSLAEAEAMVAACEAAEVPLFVHENWRWQTPIRALKQVLDEGAIGPVFRARITMVSGFPVFQNQPTLKELEQFILADMGSHLFDLARFLFGEADRLYCQTHQAHDDIRGEDVATTVLHMGGGTTVICELGYPEHFLERDPFPETLLLVEGARGSVELGQDYWVRVTTAGGTHARRCPPPRYAWANPAYDVVHASMVPCNANLLAALRGDAAAETTGQDNLRTVRLIHAAYDSAATGQAVRLT